MRRWAAATESYRWHSLRLAPLEYCTPSGPPTLAYQAAHPVLFDKQAAQQPVMFVVCSVAKASACVLGGSDWCKWIIPVAQLRSTGGCPRLSGSDIDAATIIAVSIA